MSGPRVLVLSVSAGAGHVRAAQALCAEAAAIGLNADHLDVMDFVPRWFRFAYAGMYAALIRCAPLLWGCIYRRSNRRANSGAGQRRVAGPGQGTQAGRLHLHAFPARRGAVALSQTWRNHLSGVVAGHRFRPVRILAPAGDGRLLRGQRGAGVPAAPRRRRAGAHPRPAGWSRFNRSFARWHKHWLGGAPVDYWIFLLLSAWLYWYSLTHA